MTDDVIVLGAGIVGVSIAIHLQRRGKDVILVDRGLPGGGTSFGNGGLIESEALSPLGFPQTLSQIMRYALNNRIDVHYHLRSLPTQLRFLVQYWWNSRPSRFREIARNYPPLMLSALAEHEDLVEASGARHLVRKTGWIKLFRTAQKRDHEFSAAESLKSSFGTVFERLDAGQLQLQEPDVRPDFIGGLHWNEPWCVSDPAALVGAYVRYFEELGGNFVRGDAMSLEERKSSWRFKSTEGKIEAKEAVVALGPWSSDLTTRLGYRFPIGVKRGYHMHYSLKNGSVLNNCMVDAERGYLLAPMARGLRLTTGVEFALRDAPSTPIQLERAEKIARQSFPLANRVDQHAWLGSRPCTTDMLPILGRAPRHDRLWFAFGHGHHGLTNGPLTGRLMAQLITREDPLIDPVPYSPLRFRN